MPVARISPVRVLKGHQPGSWHGTQNRRTSFNYKAYQYGTACSDDQLPGEFQAMMQGDDEGGTFESRRRASLYQALDEVGLLEVWQAYVSEHPEADL